MGTSTRRPPDETTGADGTLSNREFAAFLSAGSSVLRVSTAGNHPSPTTATNRLLTEIRDVRSMALRSSPSADSGRIAQGSAPLPISIWGVKSGFAAGDGRDPSCLFCVYRTHQQVRHLVIRASRHRREGGNSLFRILTREESSAHCTATAALSQSASASFSFSLISTATRRFILSTTMADCFSLRLSNISRRVKLSPLRPPPSPPPSTPTYYRLRNCSSFTNHGRRCVSICPWSPIHHS